MPTKREREYYRMGFLDGQRSGRSFESGIAEARIEEREYGPQGGRLTYTDITKPKRKLSKWQQFVKKNSKFPRFKYKSGAKKGRINLKALGVAYRKTQRR